MINLPPATFLKRRIAALLATIIAVIGLAAAQSPKPLTSSTNSSPDPVKAATRPITPKSAMSAPRKAAPVVPNGSSKNTNAELSQLERGQGTAASKSSGAAKVAPVKPAKSSTPKIEYRYQPPAGGKGPSTSIH